MFLEVHTDIHQPKEQEKKAITSTTVMNKKRQLDKDVIVQSKALGNYT